MKGCLSASSILILSAGFFLISAAMNSTLSGEKCEG